MQPIWKLGRSPPHKLLCESDFNISSNCTQKDDEIEVSFD